ncbi:MAG: glycoside hydrolase N-terminal domain-containing protein, partial [Haloferula sp.]
MKAFIQFARVLAIVSIPMSTALSALLPVPERGFLSARPAAHWEEGLICGNGTLGTLALSHPTEERIIFTHEELFMPMGVPVVPPDQSKHLPEIRRLIDDAKYSEAAALQAKHSGQKGFMYPDYFVPAFDLLILQPGNATTDYARTVDFTTGEARIRWSNDMGTFERSIFVSRADQVAVIRLSADEPGKLDATLKLVPRQTSEEFNQDKDIAKKSSESFREHFGELESGSTPDSLSYGMRCLKAYEGSI